jgi:hypothetical protein
MVTVSLLVAPRLGATRWIAFELAGQIALSLVLDHFGAGHTPAVHFPAAARWCPLRSRRRVSRDDKLVERQIQILGVAGVR